MEPATLFRTAGLVHVLDAILCRVIAGHSGRRKNLRTVAGLLLGICTLGTLFLLPAKVRENGGVYAPPSGSTRSTIRHNNRQVKTYHPQRLHTTDRDHR